MSADRVDTAVALTEPSPQTPGSGTLPLGPLAPPGVVTGTVTALAAPAVASIRRSLRAGLPAIYQDPADGLVMRFLWALEEVLDPLVAILDCREAYVSRELAPPAMVDELCGWLGVEPVDDSPDIARRLLLNAGVLRRKRGTIAGLRLALGLCFPDVSFDVEDSFSPAVAAPAAGGPAAGGPLAVPSRPTLSVRSATALSPQQQRMACQVIRGQCPAHVAATLSHTGGSVVVTGTNG